jgi:hypothetical protein
MIIYGNDSLYSCNEQIKKQQKIIWSLFIPAVYRIIKGANFQSDTAIVCSLGRLRRVY